MNNTYVYAHYTNDTNKIFYIGEGTLKRSKARYGRNKYWHNVVKKHNGFHVKIVASNLSKKEATRLETKLIKGLLKTGYKLTNILTSTIYEYSSSKKNPKLAAWNKEHSGKKSPVFGLKRLDLTERNKNGNFNRYSKPVLCIETKRVYSSTRDVARQHGRNLNLSSHVTDVIKGRRKTAFGFTWEYANSLNSDS